MGKKIIFSYCLTFFIFFTIYPVQAAIIDGCAYKHDKAQGVCDTLCSRNKLVYAGGKAKLMGNKDRCQKYHNPYYKTFECECVQK